MTFGEGWTYFWSAFSGNTPGVVGFVCAVIVWGWIVDFVFAILKGIYLGVVEAKR